MKAITPLTRLALKAFLLTATGIGVAQGPPGHDHDNAPPGHGGVPPGQAKKHGYYDEGPQGHEKEHGYYEEAPQGHGKEHGYYYNAPPGHGGMPPGQAKKYRHDYHFENDDRGRFYVHYRSDCDQWRYRKRPVFVTGRGIPREYVIRTVPASYWVGAPPPPPGYQYGYYGGYVVAYDPTTRIVADVLDLVVAATVR